jgi:hypothetical protein
VLVCLVREHSQAKLSSHAGSQGSWGACAIAEREAQRWAAGLRPLGRGRAQLSLDGRLAAHMHAFTAALHLQTLHPALVLLQTGCTDIVIGREDGDLAAHMRSVTATLHLQTEDPSHLSCCRLVVLTSW